MLPVLLLFLPLPSEIAHFYRPNTVPRNVKSVNDGIKCVEFLQPSLSEALLLFLSLLHHLTQSFFFVLAANFLFLELSPMSSRKQIVVVRYPV